MTIEGIKRGEGPVVETNYLRKTYSKGLKRIGVAIGIIAALGLLGAGVAGSMALIGGHASWAPHIMSVMNTVISSHGTWIPYAMTTAGGPGLLGTLALMVYGAIKGGSCVVNEVAERRTHGGQGIRRVKLTLQEPS